MLTHAKARDIRLSTSAMIRPPRRVRVSEGVADALSIANPAGSYGNWSPDVTPYMVQPLDETSSRLYESVVFGGPARSGKTIALIDGRLAYTITCNPADTLIVQTNEKQAEDFSKTRITRAIDASPKLLALKSPRAHDNNVTLKFFRNAMSLRFGWPSLSVLSGKDIHDVLMTDVDNFTGDMTIDEAFGLALKRTQTYMSAGILVAESSPARDFTDAKWKPKTPHEMPSAPGICSLYNRGDRHRWYWPCPECKEYFQASPGLDLFHLPPDEELKELVVEASTLELAEKYSMMFCSKCSVGIEHRWKKMMNAAGGWVGDGQVIYPDGTLGGERIRSRTASYWLGGCAAAYQSWESLIERYLQAYKAFAESGDEKALKTTTNVDQAMPYIPMAARAANNADDLQGRSEVWPQGTVPLGVRFLTAAVDVQGNRFQVLVLGWGPSLNGAGLERWVIDYFTLKHSQRPGPLGDLLPLDPAKFLEDWSRLKGKAFDRYFPLSDGSARQMPIRYTAIDWGGKAGVSVRALEFWRSLVPQGWSNRVRLVKGDPRSGTQLCKETYPDARNRKDRHSGAVGDVPQLLLNVNRMKDTVSANTARNKLGPGYYHFPDWLPKSFYDELTAETRGPKGWENLNKRRNEAFDLCVYSDSLSLWQKFEKIRWDAPPPWAQEWDRNSDIIDVDDASKAAIVPAPPVQREQKRWVNPSTQKNWFGRHRR